MAVLRHRDARGHSLAVDLQGQNSNLPRTFGNMPKCMGMWEDDIV